MSINSTTFVARAAPAPRSVCAVWENEWHLASAAPRGRTRPEFRTRVRCFVTHITLLRAPAAADHASTAHPYRLLFYEEARIARATRAYLYWAETSFAMVLSWMLEVPS